MDQKKMLEDSIAYFKETWPEVRRDLLWIVFGYAVIFAVGGIFALLIKGFGG